MISLSALSQSSTKSDGRTCIPDADLKNALTLVEKGKECAVRLGLYEDRMVLLQNKINYKDSIITSILYRITLSDQINETYILDIKTYEAETVAYKKEIADLKRAIKKEKLNAKLGRLGTIAAIGIGALLLITK